MKDHNLKLISACVCLMTIISVAILLNVKKDSGDIKMNEESEKVFTSKQSIENEHAKFSVEDIKTRVVGINGTEEHHKAIEYEIVLYTQNKIKPKILHSDYKLILKSDKDIDNYLAERSIKQPILLKKTPEGYLYSAKFSTVYQADLTSEKIKETLDLGYKFSLYLQYRNELMIPLKFDKRLHPSEGSSLTSKGP